MLENKNRKLLLILSIVGVVISAIVCVPFTASKISLFEIILKYAVFGLAVAGITIYSEIIKYRDYTPTNKFTVVSSYVPLFSYVAALLFDTILNVARFGSLYSNLKANLLLICCAAILVLVVFLSHLFYNKVPLLRKKEAIMTDVIFGILAIGYLVVSILIASDAYANSTQIAMSTVVKKSNVMYIIIPLILSVIIGGIHCMLLKISYDADETLNPYSVEDLYATWKKNLDKENKAYSDARNDILNTLYEFSTNQLGIERVDNEKMKLALSKKEKECDKLVKRVDVLEKELDDALAVISAAKDKIFETLQKKAEDDGELILTSLNDSLNLIQSERNTVKESKEKLVSENDSLIKELQAKIDTYNKGKAEAEQKEKEAQELAKAEAERRQREAEERERLKKPIEPAFSEVALFGKSIGADRDDIEVVPNDKQTAYRFTAHGKQFLNIQATNNDYRIFFLAKTDEMRDLLYKYNSVINFDRKYTQPVSKFETNQLKAIYRGDETISFEDLKPLMIHSLENLLESEEAERLAKEAEKAKRERAIEAERALREKERAEEKARRAEEKLLAKEAEKENKEENKTNEQVETTNSSEEAA